jgi:outer membrane receptor protein involved in Fe transport
LFELYSNFTFFLEDPINGDQIRQREARHLAQYLSTLQLEHTIGRKAARFELGLQTRFDATQNSELSKTKNRTELREALMQGDIREGNIGLYAQEEIKLSNKLDMTVGLRADHFTNRYNDQLQQTSLSAQSTIVSPKFRLNYRASNQVQLYAYGGQGFHSNDTRVSVQRNGRDVVTPAWGSDLGAVVKLGNKAILQTAFWYLWLQQEFVYVGDAGIVEPGGRTRRMGWDASVRYEIAPSLIADVDINFTAPRSLGVPREERHIPLAPTFTTTGGLTYRKAHGWNGSLRYRYMGDRAANETKSVIAEGYFVADAAVNYTARNWEIGLSVQNIFNTRWKETQFDTESRLASEPEPVSEIHFTPGTPFFARLSLSWFFR